jgi:hypothetical protein
LITSTSPHHTSHNHTSLLPIKKGLRKPSPAAYAAVQATLNTPPSSLLFVDDRKANVDAAAALTPPNPKPKQMTNVIGRRVAPAARAAAEGGRLTLADADPESRRQWRTTNQVFQACAQVSGVVGLANAGIASDIAARLHKTQGLYH